MLKFIVMQLVDNEDVICLISIICHYSSMLWIVCKHPATNTFHLKPSTNTSWTIILSLVPLFTHIRCNSRHFCFNPTTTKFIWTKHIFFYSTSFCTISPQFVRLTNIWCYWGSTSPILEYFYSRAYHINPTNEPKFTVEPDLPNEQLSPFSEDECEVLHNQP